MQYTDLLAYFNDPTLGRGRQYLLQGRIKSLNARQELGMTLIEGRVLGSQRQLYQQLVVIEQRGSLWQIDSHCDCPVGHYCKHSAAILLQYLEQGKMQVNKPNSWATDLWLTAWQQRNAPSSNSKPITEALCYELFSDQRGGAFLQLKMRRLLASGSLSKAAGRRINNQYLRDYMLATLPLIDQEIVRQLPASDSLQRIALVGESGQLLLRKLAASDKLFWQESNQPLSLAEHSLKLLQTWEQDGRQFRPVLNLNGDQLLINCTPPFVVDLAQYQLLPVDTQLSASDLQLLLQAPWFNDQNLAKLFAQPELPGPIAPPDNWVIASLSPPMQPRLRLTCCDWQYLEADLNFAYDDQLLPLDADYWPDKTMVDDATPYIICRQPDQENICWARLLDLGFVGQQATMISPSFANEQQLLQYWFEQLPKLIQLSDEGWYIEVDKKLSGVLASDENAPVLTIAPSERGWLELSLNLTLDNGDALELLPLLLECLSGFDRDQLPEQLYLRHEDEWIGVASELIQPLIGQLYELFEQPLVGGKLSFARHQMARLQELGALELNWQLPELQQQADWLSQPPSVVPLPQGLQAQLRDYQCQGLNWLQHLRRLGFGALLADDMGLGKSVQTLAHLLLEKEQGRLTQPALLVVPTSLVGNWRQESERFTPDLRVLCLQGDQRQAHFADIGQYDLVISTYPLLPRDQEQLARWPYSWLILDEAQQIKNANSKARQVLQALTAEHRLALTGTPLENHLGELWSLLDFVQPGLLGTQQLFQQRYRKTIERQQDQQQLQRLRHRIAPFILRRTKQQVVHELPDKTDIICAIDMGKQQAALYETIRLSTSSQIQQLMAAKGLARSSIEVLDALLKLRQVCCHPQLLKTQAGQRVKHSAKIDWLREQLPIMLDEGRRVLIFSQFTQYLGLIGEQLTALGIEFTKLTGQTRHRTDAIERFTSGAVPVFLISLKAGGVGLNLTQADTVIHMDPWWNPAAEQQASDRAYRIGQTKEVFVYKLVISNSLEERILQLQQHKQRLADQLYEGGDGSEVKLLQADVLAELLQPL